MTVTRSPIRYILLYRAVSSHDPDDALSPEVAMNPERLIFECGKSQYETEKISLEYLRKSLIA